MEYSLFFETEAELKKAASVIDTILLGLSGGKDSLCCLDLCVKHFKKVVPYFMYIIPELEYIEKDLQKLRDRYKIQILQYPHWALFRWLKYEYYCDGIPDMPDMLVNDIYKTIMYSTGINKIIIGAKQADSLWRRRNFGIQGDSFLIYPLKKWTKADVMAYLKINKIDVPETFAGTGHSAVGAVSFEHKYICWLYDTYPNDYEKFKQYFPYIEAIIKKREFYGKEK